MNRHEVREGQVYRDSVYECEVKVTKTDDDNVYVRDVDLLDEKGDDSGSPYPWPEWETNVDTGRFSLVEDVEVPEDPSESVNEEEDEEDSQGDLSPDEFTPNSATSW